MVSALWKYPLTLSSHMPTHSPLAEAITWDAHSKCARSIPQCWVCVQEQLPQSSNDPGILPEPVSVSAKHLDVFQQQHTGLVLLGLVEGHLYFLLCGCTGVTAQTDAIDLPDTPHKAIATCTAGEPRTTFHKAFHRQFRAQRRSNSVFPRDTFRSYSKQAHSGCLSMDKWLFLPSLQEVR